MFTSFEMFASRRDKREKIRGEKVKKKKKVREGGSGRREGAEGTEEGRGRRKGEREEGREEGNRKTSKGQASDLKLQS